MTRYTATSTDQITRLVREKESKRCPLFFSTAGFSSCSWSGMPISIVRNDRYTTMQKGESCESLYSSREKPELRMMLLSAKNEYTSSSTMMTSPVRVPALRLAGVFIQAQKASRAR